jgi:hypothetical protein
MVSLSYFLLAIPDLGHWSNVFIVKLAKLSQIAMIVEIEEISSIAKI